MINFNQSKQRQQEKRKTGIVNEMNRENNKQQRHPSSTKQAAGGRQQQQQQVGMKPNTGRQGKTMTAGMLMPSSAPTTTISKTITPPIGVRTLGQGLRLAVEPSNQAPSAHHPVVVGRRQQQQQRLLVGQTSQQQQQPRRLQTTAKVANSALMKKAYVRFDDYLDLNEENMRRSCKRLMNHLYSDGPEPKEPMSCCRPSSSAPLKCPPRTPPPPPPTSTLTPRSTATGAPSSIRLAGANNNQASSSYSDGPATTNGKSYLRSQYERRQLRQLELMNKMQHQQQQQQQQQPMAPSKLQIADGASKCVQKQEQQQQDLVAKSHELSKRRFFEQLERRESIKNLNLGPQQPIPTILVKGTALVRQREASFSADEKLANDEKGVSPASTASARDKQKSLGNSGDGDEENDARLKVYQSIVLNNAESPDCCITNTNNEEPEMGHQMAAMLEGGSGGAFRGLLEDEIEFGGSKELAVELIGFYTPSPQSPANNNEDDQRRLIEFSLERQLERLDGGGGEVQENLHRLALESNYNVSASDLDESAFEIKVPPQSADSHQFDPSANPLSSAIAGSQLVVKQVEVADEARCLLSPQPPLVEATNADEVGSGGKRLPTLNSKRLESVSAPAIAQHPAANKTKTKPDADLTENKVKLIEAAHHQRSGQEQGPNRAPISKSTKFGRNKQRASNETMAFVKGSRKLVVVAPKSQPAGDNKQKKLAGISSTISGGKHKNNTTKMSKAISLELGNGFEGSGGGCSSPLDETTGLVGTKLADKLFASTGALSSATKTTTSTLTFVDDAATAASSTAIGPGATNCRAKHHGGPETASAGAVGQSGGAGSDDGQSLSACLVQLENEKESAAQQVATTQQGTSLRTTITTDKTGAKIRDVLPGASSAKGTNSIEAVVSGCGHLSKADKGKVIAESSGAFERQTNQVQQQPKQDKPEYANPSAANSTGDGGEHTGKNNVNHELSGYNTLAATILCRRQQQANIDLLALESHHQHLIESSLPIKHPVMVVEKQSQVKRNGSVQEEDEGSSSCSSSSGFGASVSVTSSSSIDGSQSRSPKLKTCSNDFNRTLKTSSSFPATKSEQVESHEVEEEELNGPEEPHYDRIRSVRDHQWETNQQVNQMRSPCQTLDKKTIDEGEGGNGAGRDGFHDYKELVGPDQAYPSRFNHQHHQNHRRHHHYHHHHQLTAPATLFVENHNYAPLLNRSSCTTDPELGNSNSKLDYYSTSIVLERDSLLEGYANLPMARNNKPPVPGTHIVEYATVRQQQQHYHHDHQQQMEMSGSKKKGQVIENCSGASSEVGGLSGHSYSSSGSSSAKSGGFSTLTPAPCLLGDCLTGEEQQQSIEAEQAMGTRKRTSSLLKRFGSLVSKAFMSNVATGAQLPATSKISESFAAPGASEVLSGIDDEQLNSNASKSTQSSGPRSILVLENNSDPVAVLATSEGSADAGNDNDNRNSIGICVEEKPDLVILPTKNHVNQRKQLETADLASVRHHDDRLSRATKKQHSRKIKSNNSSSSSVASLSSSFSSSSGTGSFSGGISNGHHHRGRSHHLGRRHSHHHHHHHGHQHHHHHRRQTKKSDSLFEDLESLMSPSEEEEDEEEEEKEAYGQSATYDEKENSPRLSRRRASSSVRRQRINIDCVSPTDKSPKHAINTCGQSVISKSSGPRSLLRLFSPSSIMNNSQHHQSQQQQNKATAESTPNLANLKVQRRKKRDTSQCDINELQPISGFWGFSSLIGQKHVTVGKTSRSQKQQAKLGGSKGGAGDDRDLLEYNSPNLKPLEAGYELHLDNPVVTATGRKQQQSQNMDSKHQSLNLYRNLLRNYTKRRHHRLRGHHHHHHGHHHHHHHHHHRHQSLASVNTASVPAATAGLATGSCARQHRLTRCAQGCTKNCPTKLSAYNATGNASSSCSTATNAWSSNPDKLVFVWGQLIKINKLDGSQVIELQRSPGKSWGFFVARGAINNVKGIFISRMHDKVTSDSLTGLLSIGDRILAIDECPIEPDYDILRVNQMISKKIKILLKVKPFKG